MKIVFGDIGREKSRYTFQDDSWLPAGEVETVSPVTAEIMLKATIEETASLEGRITGSFRLDCGRCGDPVTYELDEKFYYSITTRKEEVSELQEKECSDEECDTMYLQEPVIDVIEILREQFYLSVPGKVVCRDTCRGLCPECGGSLNRDECSCVGPQPETPFAVLKKLKKD